MPVIEYREFSTAPLPLGADMQALAVAAQNRQRVQSQGTPPQLSFTAKRGSK